MSSAVTAPHWVVRALTRKKIVPVTGTEGTWSGTVHVHAIECNCLFAFAL